MTKIAIGGDAAPGTATTFSAFGSLTTLNNSGQIALDASLTDGGIGFWTYTGGTLTKVARNGDAAPGTATTFSGFGTLPALNNSGQITFRALMTGGGQGIWTNLGGALNKFAVTSDAAPGTATTFNTFGTPYLNNSGQIVFFANLTGGGNGIWTTVGGPLTKVARTGDAAPGTTSTYNNFTSPGGLNSSGQIAFNATLTGGTGGSGIWTTVGGPLTKVARTGDAAPGTATTFSAFNGPVLNNAGRIVFEGSLTGGGTGFWTYSGGTLTKVVRNGDTAPGTGGAAFNSFLGLASNSDYIAFTGGLVQGGSVDSSNDEGLWVRDGSGQLTLVLRQGDLFDIDGAGPGSTFKTIFSINIGVTGFTEGSGYATCLSDTNQFTFRLRFTDDTQGVYLTPLPVPEPSGVLLTSLLAGLAVGVGRRYLPSRRRSPVMAETGHLCGEIVAGKSNQGDPEVARRL